MTKEKYSVKDLKADLKVFEEVTHRIEYGIYWDNTDKGVEFYNELVKVLYSEIRLKKGQIKNFAHTSKKKKPIKEVEQ